MRLKDLFLKYKHIILINQISFIGDSIIFFWPMVNGLKSVFLDKEIRVFHPHYNLFKPTNDTVRNRPLTEFYDQIKADENTLVLAFIKGDGQLKEYLKLSGFQSIVKGMVGFDFISFNLPDIDVSSNEFDRIRIDATEIKYSYTNRETHIRSGFPLLKQTFSNVYEYSKICNESFFGLKEMDIACKENIVINKVNNQETFADLFDAIAPYQERKYILINLICGTFKEGVQENYIHLLIWIKETVITAGKEDIAVWLLVDNKFPGIRKDLHLYAANLFYLKEHSSMYWTSLIKKAEKVYSIDTGFLHIAHILNKNTVGFGGDVDFWFFKDKIIEIKETCI
jgi:hypothetical protein